jgi:hypothetical protein
MRREEYIVVFTTQLILDNNCILYLLITLTRWQLSLLSALWRSPNFSLPMDPETVARGTSHENRQAIGFLPISERRSPRSSLYKPFPFLSVHHSDLNCGPINTKLTWPSYCLFFADRKPLHSCVQDNPLPRDGQWTWPFYFASDLLEKYLSNLQIFLCFKNVFCRCHNASFPEKNFRRLVS